MGGGQQSEKDGPKGALSALKKGTAAVQENDIRRRSSMQLGGETHIPMCHDKQRGCVSIRSFFFFSTTTVRCVASVCRAKQQVRVASKEGASRKEFFSNTEQGGAKSNRKQKQKKERNRRRNQLIQRQIKSKIQTSHLFTLSDREQTKTGWVG